MMLPPINTAPPGQGQDTPALPPLGHGPGPQYPVQLPPIRDPSQSRMHPSSHPGDYTRSSMGPSAPSMQLPPMFPPRDYPPQMDQRHHGPLPPYGQPQQMAPMQQMRPGLPPMHSYPSQPDRNARPPPPPDRPQMPHTYAEPPRRLEPEHTMNQQQQLPPMFPPGPPGMHPSQQQQQNGYHRPPPPPPPAPPVHHPREQPPLSPRASRDNERRFNEAPRSPPRQRPKSERSSSSPESSPPPSSLDMRSVTLSTLITAGLIQPGAILQHRGYSCTLTGYGTLIPLEPRPMFLLPEYSSPSAWTTAIARKGNPASKASINGWEAVKCVINGSEVLLGNMRRKYAEEGGNIKGEWCAQDEEKYAKKKKKKRKNSMSHMMSRFKSAAEPSPAMIAAMQQAAREQQDERARQRAQQDLAELYSQRSATSAAAALTAAASRVNGTRPSQNGNGTPHLSHKRSHSSIDDSGDLVKGADVLLSIASKSKKESPEVKSEASNPPAGLESLAVEALLGMGTRVGA